MQEKLLKIIKKLIYQILEKENLLQGQWHLGKVNKVINSKLLSVFVDGSNVAQTIPCSPDIVYEEMNEVWVVFINSSSSNKFVISKRGV